MFMCDVRYAGDGCAINRATKSVPLSSHRLTEVKSYRTFYSNVRGVRIKSFCIPQIIQKNIMYIA